MREEKETKGTLFVVATPIGNLEDITYRALQTLREVSCVACEDTRVTKRLFDRYEITTPTLTYHQHSPERSFEKILSLLAQGEDIALVTDAGTPGISDPGNRLVDRVVDEGYSVIPLPGPSAITTLASVSGRDMQQFTFLGFVPHKKGRQTFFDRVVSSDIPVMYYDSVHRVIKNFELLTEKSPQAEVIVGRELTKMFEEIQRGTVEEVLSYYREHPEKVKGEFVIIVDTRERKTEKK